MQADAATANGIIYPDEQHPGKVTGVFGLTALTLAPRFEYARALQDAMHIVLNQGQTYKLCELTMHVKAVMMLQCRLRGSLCGIRQPLAA